MKRLNILPVILLLIPAVAASQACFDYGAVDDVIQVLQTTEIAHLDLAGDVLAYCGPDPDDGSSVRVGWCDVAPDGSLSERGVLSVPAAEPLGLAVCGDLVLLAGGESGLAVIDFSDPDAPTAGGVLAGDYRCVDAWGGEAYAVEDAPDAYLVHLGLSDPTNPAASARVHAGAYALGHRILVEDGRVRVLADQWVGFFDSTTPSAPVKVYEYRYEHDGAFSETPLSFARAGDLLGILLHVRIPGQMEPTIYFITYDVSMDQLTLVGYYNVLPANASSGLCLGASQVSVANGDLFRNYSYAAGTVPVSNGIHDLGSEIVSVVGDGTLDWVATEAGAIHRIRSTDSAANPVVHEYERYGNPGGYAPYAVGSDLYVATVFPAMSDFEQDAYYVEYWDHADPAAPVLQASFRFFDNGSFAVGPAHLYHGDDVYDRYTLEPVGDLPGCRPSAVRGGALYAAQSSGLRVFDLSDPVAPVETTPVLAGRSPVWLAETGGVAYVRTGLDVVALDLSVPLAPVEAGEWTPPVYPECAVAASGHLFIASGSQLVIYELTDPHAPVLRSQTTVSGDVQSLCLLGGALYLSLGNDGLEVVDVSEPTAPMSLGDWTDGRFHGDLAPLGDTVLSTGQYPMTRFAPQCGATIPVEDPWTPETPRPELQRALAAPVPNPFNPSTELTFTLERPGAVLLTVHDALGRRVRVLASGLRGEGPHVVRWDGRDASGRAAPAGVYFARFTADGVSETRKLALVK